MNSGKIVISKKAAAKGDDGHKIFSVRIREETVQALDELAVKSNRSRNELINIFLEFGVHNVEIDDKN